MAMFSNIRISRAEIFQQKLNPGFLFNLEINITSLQAVAAKLWKPRSQSRRCPVGQLCKAVHS